MNLKSGFIRLMLGGLLILALVGSALAADKPNIVVIWGADYVSKFLATFQDYPPRQKAASFTIDQVIEQLAIPASGG